MKTSIAEPYWNICRKVYLLWAVIILVGFIATQFHQLPDINYLWVFLSVLGLSYMAFLLFQMRFRDIRLLYIGVLWLLTISFGLIVSFTAFVHAPLAEIAATLGVFWLLLLGIAHIFNGTIDRSFIYLITGGLQILTGVGCLLIPAFLEYQYFIAGVIGSMAMVGLILYR